MIAASSTESADLPILVHKNLGMLCPLKYVDRSREKSHIIRSASDQYLQRQDRSGQMRIQSYL